MSRADFDTLEVGSLFTGIGGFDLALERAGFTIAWQCETDRFCRRVLAKHWPDVQRGENVCRVGTWVVERESSDIESGGDESFFTTERVDLLVGGWPCQDFSVAGKRAGLAGERSGLFWEIVRIAQVLKPPWGLFENVPGLFSTHGGRDMAAVLEGLRQCWPVVGYRMLDSQHFGVPQRRRRVFLVGGPTERGVAEALALGEGGGGYPAARGEAEEDVAGSLGGGTRHTDRRTKDDPNLVIARTLTAPSQPHYDGDTENFVVGALGMNKERGGWRAGPDEAMAGHLVMHTLTGGQGFDASEDGTGRGTPLYYSHDYNQDRIYPADGVIPAHTANDSNRSRNVSVGPLVRRFTPIECERLQGFPDGYTCLCGAGSDWRACSCTDSLRYRALGNAVTVPVVEWIGQRLRRAMRRERECA